MKTVIVGIGGITNGGKSTLAASLHEQIPNSCIVAQDTYFKDDSVVPVDSNGFKQYDVLEALLMDQMMDDIDLWRRDPETFLKERGLEPMQTSQPGSEVYVLIVEGFLIFNYSLRVYNPPDPPGYFDGHVWPMYLKHRKGMEAMVSDIVFLNGLQEKEQLLDSVYKDVLKTIQEQKERE